jgi:hypothetical protein
MDIVTISAIAVLIYVSTMFILKVSLFGIYIYFVVKFFNNESTSSVDSDQFNPNLNY